MNSALMILKTKWYLILIIWRKLFAVQVVVPNFLKVTRRYSIIPYMSYIRLFVCVWIFEYKNVEFSHSLDLGSWTEIRTLGNGSFGEVKLYDNSESKDAVTVKVVKGQLKVHCTCVTDYTTYMGIVSFYVPCSSPGGLVV